MEVLLVYPDILFKGANWPGYYYHGIGFLAASLKKAGDSVNLLHLTKPVQQEEYLEKVSQFDTPGVIGFSVTSNMWPYAKEWIGWTREKFTDAIIICGGVHPTLNPEEVIVTNGVDAICVGEGEEALIELCENLKEDRDITKIHNIWIKNKGTIHKNHVRLL